MDLRSTSLRGHLVMDGRMLPVTYDIPGAHDEGAVIAGAMSGSSGRTATVSPAIACSNLRRRSALAFEARSPLSTPIGRRW